MLKNGSLTTDENPSWFITFRSRPRESRAAMQLVLIDDHGDFPLQRKFLSLDSQDDGKGAQLA